MNIKVLSLSLLSGLASVLISGCNSSQKEVSDNVYNITDFDAVGDGKTLNTAAIQKALDAASETGGTVYIPAGTFVSGTVFIKSNTVLELSAKATLLGSPNIEDYKEMTWGHNKDRQPYHLIVAEDAENIRITGTGTIDGNGEAFWKEMEKDEKGNVITPRWIAAKDKKVSPLIELVRCKNLFVENVTIKTGGGWNLHLHDCDIAKVSGVNIINSLYSPNSDGIDITGCHDVTVSDCYIRTCDDAICLKTVPDSRDCRRITVTNCIMETFCVGLKLGCNESFKDMSDVTFSNCVVNGSSRAVGIYVREGAVYENINITNITANTNAALIYNRPIHIMVEKATPESKMGGIRNVSISNFTCQTEGRILIHAEKGGFIENVTLRDINLQYPWIENPEPMVAGASSNQFPKLDKHPEVLGKKSAIVAENVTNLVIDNLILGWPQAGPAPKAWSHPERIENGSNRIHKYDYSNARMAELNVLWAKDVKGGYVYAPLSASSNAQLPKYDLKNSTLNIRE